MFNDVFKYYKSRKSPPNLESVIDVRKTQNQSVRKVNICSKNETSSETDLGLKYIKEWNVYEFINIPGLILIENPFTIKGQQDWIIKCLKDYTKKPNILNIDKQILFNNNETWWDNCFGSALNKDLMFKLRWATFGYHHNWDTKQYSENLKSEMPKDIEDLIKFFANILGFNEFKAEAGIINYYNLNSTLTGHKDHSEIFLEAPLFSISFGQTAIFLIGGSKKEDSADAIFLRSGDVLVMSGSSRLRYHGVPKILTDESMIWDLSNHSLLNSEDWQKVKFYISENRININIRQVLKPGQLNL